MWVIDFFARNGFYVLIDDHLREDRTLTNKGQDVWVADWKALATKIYASMPESSANHVMFDLLNEPDEVGILWDKPVGTKKIQLDKAYLAAMDEINSVTNGKNLFLVEGTGQTNYKLNWGDGFITDKSIIAEEGLSDPNNFFTQLATKPYQKQVVVSPHIYPPSVSKKPSDTGTELYNRLSTSFGYLNKTGYCINTTCYKYPVAIGEFGSWFEKQSNPQADYDFFDSFAKYLNNTGDAADGKHEAVDNWFYWSYNPNSSDTGGIVSTDNNWRDIQWSKIDYLSNGVLSTKTTHITNPNGLGLVPWYK